MRKTSGEKAAENFKKQLQELDDFLDQKNLSSLSDAHVTWAYDYAIIRLYREFEGMILKCLVAAINNDTKLLSETTGINFPKNLREEVCEFIIVGPGYFDFKGRSGLISEIKKYLPDDHYLTSAVKNSKYKKVLDQLSALRNFAAHNSKPSKRQARQATSQERLKSAGAWLKTQGRFHKLTDSLKDLADEIQQNAPY